MPFSRVEKHRKKRVEKSGWDNRETRIKRVNRAKPMLEDEAYGADKKQYDSRDADKPRSPSDSSRNGIGRVQSSFLTSR